VKEIKQTDAFENTCILQQAEQ